MFFPVAEAVIQIDDHAADQPSEWVSQSYPGNGICDAGYNKQINLAEQDEAAHHDKHRRPRVSGSAQRSGDNELGRLKWLDKGNDPENLHTDRDTGFIICIEGRQWSPKQYKADSKHNCDNHAGTPTAACVGLRHIRTPFAETLSHK